MKRVVYSSITLPIAIFVITLFSRASFAENNPVVSEAIIVEFDKYVTQSLKEKRESLLDELNDLKRRESEYMQRTQNCIGGGPGNPSAAIGFIGGSICRSIRSMNKKIKKLDNIEKLSLYNKIEVALELRAKTPEPLRFLEGNYIGYKIALNPNDSSYHYKPIELEIRHVKGWEKYDDKDYEEMSNLVLDFGDKTKQVFLPCLAKKEDNFLLLRSFNRKKSLKTKVGLLGKWLIIHTVNNNDFHFYQKVS